MAWNWIAAALATAVLVGCSAAGRPAAPAAPAPAPESAAPPPAQPPAQEQPAVGAAKAFAVTIEAGEIDENRYFYKPERVTVPAGTPVRMTLKNVGKKKHNLGVIGWAGAPETDDLEPGQSQTLEFTPPRPGEFSLVCSLRGHKAKGMNIPFIVTPAEPVPSAPAR